MNSLKRTPLIYAATFILFAATSHAQSGKQQSASPLPATVSTENAIRQNGSAKQQLQDFKPDRSNPELSQLKYNLLEAQVKLEKAQSDNSLSPSEMEGLNNRIKMLQSKIEAMTYMESVQGNVASTPHQRTRPVKDKEVVEKEILNAAIESKQITREQFIQLSYVRQKEVILNGCTVTDLVNNNAETYKAANANPIFVVASDFNNYSTEKQIHILNNPQSYIVVQHASQIPGNNTERQEPALTKYKISKAELNQFSPERRKAIEESPNFTITD
jgi:hypothetical protein